MFIYFSGCPFAFTLQMVKMLAGTEEHLPPRLVFKQLTNRKLVLHEFHETCHSRTFCFMRNDSKRCCDTTTPESIHTKDESKRGFAFAFIFGVN